MDEDRDLRRAALGIGLALLLAFSAGLGLRFREDAAAASIAPTQIQNQAQGARSDTEAMQRTIERLNSRIDDLEAVVVSLEREIHEKWR